MSNTKKYNGIKAVIYLRVSSKEQEEGYSIPAQLRIIRQYADNHEITIVGEPIIETASAKKTGRKKFDEMVALLKKEARTPNNLGISVILTEKTDRLVRNHRDKETLLSLGVTMHLVKEHIIVNSESPSAAIFMFDSLVSNAARYSGNLGEEASKGMLEKAREGWYPSRAPFGYINQTRNDEKKIILPDPVFGKYARKLYEYYATGYYSLNTLVDKVNNEMKDAGLKKRLIKSSVAKILANPIYIGEYYWKKMLLRGKHEPLITREIYDRVQTRLHGCNKHQRQSRDKDRWIFQGLLTCGYCGCAVVAEMKKDRYVYYHCTGNKGKCAGKRVVNQDILVTELISILEEVVRAQMPLDEILKIISYSQSDARNQRLHVIEKIKLDIKKDCQRRDKLLLKEIDGDIDPQRFQQLDAQLEKNLEENRAQLLLLESDDSEFIKDQHQLTELLDKAVDLFKEPSRSDQERRQLIKTFMGPSVLKDRRLYPTLRKPFDKLVKLRARQ